MRDVVASIGNRGGILPPLLALLLLFRLLIPSGYMIAPDHHGRPGLTLCAAPAQTAAEPARHGGHAGEPDDPFPSKPGERPCPFAALAPPPLPPEPPVLLAQVPAVAVLPDLPARAHVPQVASAAPPPPATGPPPSV